MLRFACLFGFVFFFSLCPAELYAKDTDTKHTQFYIENTLGKGHTYYIYSRTHEKIATFTDNGQSACVYTQDFPTWATCSKTLREETAYVHTPGCYAIHYNTDETSYDSTSMRCSGLCEG